MLAPTTAVAHAAVSLLTRVSRGGVPGAGSLGCVVNLTKTAPTSPQQRVQVHRHMLGYARDRRYLYLEPFLWACRDASLCFTLHFPTDSGHEGHFPCVLCLSFIVTCAFNSSARFFKLS